MRILWPTVIGTYAVISGARALNQYLERDVDALMQRTCHRPIPSQRLTAEQVLTFGVLCACAGLLCLLYWVNTLTAVLETIALTAYLFLYTPLKQRSALCTLVGAIPGSIPAMVGWTALYGTLTPSAWLLAAILFLWQLPHFLAIAWVCKDDYARANFQFLTSNDPTGWRTGSQILLYVAALLCTTLLPTMLGTAGSMYFLGALILGIGLASFSIATALQRSPVGARRLFVASIIYLPILFLLMAMDQVPL
jgi:heme o synthase